MLKYICDLCKNEYVAYRHERGRIRYYPREGVEFTECIEEDGECVDCKRKIKEATEKERRRLQR